MKYRKEIDGLRAFAVLPVIFFHAGFQLFSGGFVGVDIFFVISGYLITSILLTEMTAQRFSFLSFYERRARRILPALALVMLLCLPFAWRWLLPNALVYFSRSLIGVSFFSSNILFWREVGYFYTGADLSPLLHTWSLAVEEQYYIFFPPLLLWGAKLGKRPLQFLLFVLGILSLALSQWGAHHMPVPNFYLLPSRCFEFIIGTFVAYYRLEQPEETFDQKKWHNLLSFLGVILILLSIFTFDQRTPLPSILTLVPTLGTALVILFARPATWAGKILSLPILVDLGLMSYSLYLWHQPIFAFVKHRTVVTPSPLVFGALILLSLGLASLSYRYIETPFRNKNWVSRKGVFTFAGLSFIFFTGIGILGISQKGFPRRFPSELLQSMTPDGSHAPGCDELVERTTGSTCTIGAQVPPSLALIGDSHSATLTESLQKALQLKNQSVIVFSQSWCVPLLDMAAQSNLKRPFCREFIQHAFEYVVHHPEIKTVILDAEWANYTEGLRFGEDHVEYYTDAESTVKSLTENRQVFRRALERTKILLKSNNKQVIVVKGVPEYETFLPEVLFKQKYYHGYSDLPKSLEVTPFQYQARNTTVENAFKESDLSSWAQVIDPFSIFCGTVNCRYQDERGHLYYADENHLSAFGAQKIVDQMHW